MQRPGSPSLAPLPLRGLSALIAVTLLASCGGGGGGDDTPASTIDTTAPTTTTTDTVTPPAATDDSLFDTEGSAFYLGAQNSARLQGPVLGTGERSTAEISKLIPFEVGESQRGLEMRGVTVARDSAIPDERASVHVVVENTSSELLCFVRPQGLEILGADGGVLEDRDGLVLTVGAIGKIGFANDFSCVPAGAKVVVTSLAFVSFDDAASARFTSLSSSEGAGDPTLLDLAVEPVSYDVAADGTLEITIANRGTGDADLEGVWFFALGDRGEILGGGVAAFGSVLAPGEEGVATSSFPLLGQASTLRVVTNYDAVDD